MRRWTQEEPRCYVCGSLAQQARVLVDVATAGRICWVSRAPLHRWMEAGLVEWLMLPHGRRRLYLDSLFREPPRPDRGML